MLNKYESMVIISSAISEDVAKQENAKILNFIKENGGEIIKTDEWGKKRLAYQINKSKDGYYFVNYFNLDATKTSELERLYRINENIIRFNILVK